MAIRRREYFSFGAQQNGRRRLTRLQRRQKRNRSTLAGMVSATRRKEGQVKVAKYVFAVVGALLVAGVVWGPLRAKAQRQVNQPTQFQVDPFYPKTLPRDALTGKPWVTGEVGGTCLDSQDHLFTVNRAAQNGLIAPETVIATASPVVIEYDREGNIVNAFGN